jgi:hypothetical protein
VALVDRSANEVRLGVMSSQVVQPERTKQSN